VPSRRKWRRKSTRRKRKGDMYRGEGGTAARIYAKDVLEHLASPRGCLLKSGDLPRSHSLLGSASKDSLPYIFPFLPNLKAPSGSLCQRAEPLSLGEKLRLWWSRASFLLLSRCKRERGAGPSHLGALRRGEGERKNKIGRGEATAGQDGASGERGSKRCRGFPSGRSCARRSIRYEDTSLSLLLRSTMQLFNVAKSPLLSLPSYLTFALHILAIPISPSSYHGG